MVWLSLPGPCTCCTAVPTPLKSLNRFRRRTIQALKLSTWNVKAHPSGTLPHQDLLQPPSTVTINSSRYEKMKRRLLKVEMERRHSEDMRKQREKGGKTADEVRAAASRSRLARAGYRGLSSIMHVGGRPAEVRACQTSTGWRNLPSKGQTRPA